MKIRILLDLAVVLGVTAITATEDHARELCPLVWLEASHAPRYLVSPGFPLGYRANRLCKWRIYAAEGRRIKIVVKENELDWRKPVPCEEQDHIRLEDDGNPDSKLVFCDGEFPSFLSSTNNVQITFRSYPSKSTSSTLGRGFKLQYAAVGGPKTKYLLADTRPRLIQLPTTSSFKPKFVDRSWKIASPESKKPVYIRVKLLSLGTSCETDYLEAFDAEDNTGSLLGRWCGKQTSEKYSSGQYIYLHLHAKNYQKSNTWIIEYGIDEDTESASSVPKIAGISIGVIATIAVVFLTVRIACDKCKYKDDEESSACDMDLPEANESDIMIQRENSPNSELPQTTISTTPQYLTPTAPPMSSNISAPPPSYEEAMGVMETGN